MAERQNIPTFLEIVTIKADKYNVPVEIVEDILIAFVKILYEDMRSEFEFPES